MTTMPLEATLTPAGEARPTPETGRLYVLTTAGMAEKELTILGVGLLSEPTTKLLFGAINDPRLRLKQPFPLTISRREGSVVVSSDDLEEFGYGPTLSDALEDFGKTICELYHSLEAEERRLSNHLKQTLATLRRYLEPRRLTR